MGERPSYGDRPPRPRGEFAERPPRPRGEFAERPPRGEFVPQDRGPRPGGFAPRPMDDGGMSIRLDPRRLNALKLLAAEAGVRPGELVTRWVEERLDAARPGTAAPIPSAPAPDALRALSTRIDELARRLDALTPAPVAGEPTPVAVAAEPKRRGRPPKAAAAAEAAKATPKARVRRAVVKGAVGKGAVVKGAAKVALHDEISAVISELGPQTAAELAGAITERGRYRQPRSAKPLDAATVNARVSNPKYRPLFVRREGRIGLAAE
jgi:hypothetical protein